MSKKFIIIANFIIDIESIEFIERQINLNNIIIRMKDKTNLLIPFQDKEFKDQTFFDISTQISEEENE